MIILIIFPSSRVRVDEDVAILIKDCHVNLTPFGLLAMTQKEGSAILCQSIF